jgi:hypothetical protein
MLSKLFCCCAKPQADDTAAIEKPDAPAPPSPPPEQVQVAQAEVVEVISVVKAELQQDPGKPQPVESKAAQRIREMKELEARAQDLHKKAQEHNKKGQYKGPRLQRSLITGHRAAALCYRKCCVLNLHVRAARTMLVQHIRQWSMPCAACARLVPVRTIRRCIEHFPNSHSFW